MVDSVRLLWPVFPIRIFFQDGHWHKVPRFVGWREHAAPAPNQISEWWRAQGGNFGIELGGAGFVVIDADRHGVDGVAALDHLIRGQDWPAHPIVATAGNGFHHIFRQSADPLGQRHGKLPAGIDVRGVGGWIVAPGSRRPDGAEWRLVEDCEPPVLPRWIEETIKAAPQIRLVGDPHHGPLVASSHELPRDLYFKLLRLVPRSPHHQRRVRGILNIALQRRDHRNDGLNIAAFCLRELVHDQIVSRTAAEELLLNVARLNGYIAKDGFEAAWLTIQSGLGS
jgi:hypothetical protein